MASTSVPRVKKHRDNLRAQGLRPVQIWVPDPRAPGFAEEARRQSLVVAGDASEAAILSWADEVADRSGWV